MTQTPIYTRTNMLWPRHVHKMGQSQCKGQGLVPDLLYNLLVAPSTHGLSHVPANDHGMESCCVSRADPGGAVF